MDLQPLQWLGIAATVVAVWGALGEIRLWWQLGFRSPRYFKISLAAALGLGILSCVFELQDEARPIAFVVYLVVLPLLVVFGFLFYGGPSEYLRTRPLTTYSNGVHAGAALRLKSDLAVHEEDGRPSGVVIPAGSLWVVLPGSIVEPDVVWLEQPDGDLHIWDSQSLLDYFQLSEDAAA